MVKETQITMKISQPDFDIIKKASELLSVGHSTFCRSCAIKEARQILLNNNIQI